MPSEFILDFSDVSTVEFEPVPVGVYSAIIDATPVESDGIKYGQGKGTPYVRIGFTITSPQEYAKRKVYDQFMLAGPGAVKTARLIKAVGIDPTLGGKQQFNFKKIHGKPCTIKVSQREYNGQMYNKIDSIMPPAKDAPLAPTGTDAAFD